MVDSDMVTVTVVNRFYSGNVAGPDFCTNHSLGGARTYANDVDGDGVADQCSLATTRREAIARQTALENTFIVTFTAACRALGTQDFGDAPSALARDLCVTDPTTGRPLGYTPPTPNPNRPGPPWGAGPARTGSW